MSNKTDIDQGIYPHEDGTVAHTAMLSFLVGELL